MRTSRAVLFFLVFLLLLTTSSALAQGPVQPTLVRLPFASPVELNRLIDTYDVWEVDYAGRTALVALAPAEVDRLVKRGVSLTVDPADKSKLADGYPACYLTVDDLYATMAQLAADYPALVAVEDYGATWLRLHPDERGRGSRLLTLVLGNRAAPDPRPTLFLMAGIHARELATPELALAFARQLLTGYGVDADATWLLDSQRFVIILTANPDGHRVAEQGYYQRKNANDTAGDCPIPPSSGSQYGVDLNRNHSYLWGTGGSSDNPCAQTYRGVAPGSEVETQAIQELAAAFIHTRRLNDISAMPLTTPDLLISLHSYGQWVLWPWGYTRSPAPDLGMSRLGYRMAAFNRYTPGQASATLYDTSGDTTDWAYGYLGVPAFTFEIGTSFFQPCQDLPDILTRNLPALHYAARVARAPYDVVRGPDLFAVPADLGTVQAGTPVILTVGIDATAASSATVGGGEVKVGQHVWEPGNGIPLAPVDGAFDTANERGRAVLLTGDLAPGRHLVYARGRDAGGAWGPVYATWLTVAGPSTASLTGTVIGGDSPLAGARLVAWPGGAMTTTDAQGHFSLTVQTGRSYRLSISAPGFASGQVSQAAVGENVSVELAPLPCILLVDGDPDGQAQATWTADLAALGRPFHVWQVADTGAPRLDTLRQYGTVIWMGGSRGGLSEAQHAALQGYLDGGGHLLLSGHRLLQGPTASTALFSPDLTRLKSYGQRVVSVDPTTYFFTHDLHAVPDATATGATLVGANFLSAMDALNLGVSPASAALTLRPSLGGAALLRYGTGGPAAAVAYADDTRRVVTLGFGLEIAAGDGARQFVLASALRWLGCPGACARPTDVDRDGAVGDFDVQLVAQSWPAKLTDPGYVRHHDLNGDSRIDVVDLALVAQDWGQSCP